MGFQLPELPVGISGVTYGVAGFFAAAIVVAELSWGPDVSMAYDRNPCSPLEPSSFSLAQCNPDRRLKQLAWRLVGRIQVSDERSKYHTTRLREGTSHAANGFCIVTLDFIVQICTVQGRRTHPLDGHSKQPRTPEGTGESV